MAHTERYEPSWVWSSYAQNEALRQGAPRSWSGRLLAELKGFSVYGRNPFSPDGQHILTFGKGDRTIRVWNLSGRPFATIKRGDVVSSPDSKRFLIWNGTLATLWDLSGHLLTTLKGHQGNIIDASISPDTVHRDPRNLAQSCGRRSQNSFD